MFWQWKVCFFFVFLKFNVWASLYWHKKAVFTSIAQSLKSSVCSPKFWFIFFICCIAESLEAAPDPVFSKHMCDVWTWTLQFSYSENRLYSEAGDILCLPAKLMKWSSGAFFNVGVGIFAISRISATQMSGTLFACLSRYMERIFLAAVLSWDWNFRVFSTITKGKNVYSNEGITCCNWSSLS